MPRLSFTLRDVFWLTLVVGMGVGWGIQARRQAARIAVSDSELRDVRAEYVKLADAGKAVTAILEAEGYSWHTDRTGEAYWEGREGRFYMQPPFRRGKVTEYLRPVGQP